jgi:hypothetical protein
MDNEVSIAAAVAAFEQGDLGRARRLAEERFAKGEQSPVLHHLMGLIECRAGRVDAGVHLLQRRQTRTPTISASG